MPPQRTYVSRGASRYQKHTLCAPLTNGCWAGGRHADAAQDLAHVGDEFAGFPCRDGLRLAGRVDEEVHLLDRVCDRPAVEREQDGEDVVAVPRGVGRRLELGGGAVAHLESRAQVASQTSHAPRRPACEVFARL